VTVFVFVFSSFPLRSEMTGNEEKPLSFLEASRDQHHH